MAAGFDKNGVVSPGLALLGFGHIEAGTITPNTPELRKLQGSRYLATLLQALMDESHLLAQKHNITQHPLLIKIAPDLAWAA